MNYIASLVRDLLILDKVMISKSCCFNYGCFGYESYYNINWPSGCKCAGQGVVEGSILGSFF